MPAPPARTELADAYPLPSNATLRAGHGKLWDYVTGLLGSSGNVADARAALGLGAAGATLFRNRIINGGFRVNQRAIVAGTFGAGAYVFDRWKAGAAGCSFTFSTTENVTTLTISAGSLQQVIEGTNLQSGTHVLAWTGTATGKIGAGAYSADGVTGAVTGGTNLVVEFATGTLSNVQFEPGTVSTAFENSRPLGLELALCERYFQFAFPDSGVASGTANFIFNVKHRVPMRAAATYVLQGSMTITNGAANFVQGGSAHSASSQTVHGASINAGGFSGLTSTAGYIHTNSILISASAEL